MTSVIPPAALIHRTSASAAATAIRHLCDACARQLAPHWDLVAAMYDGVQAAGGAAPPPANGAAVSPLLEEDVHNVSHRHDSLPAVLTVLGGQFGRVRVLSETAAALCISCF